MLRGQYCRFSSRDEEAKIGRNRILTTQSRSLLSERVALARERSYTLFSALFLEGITPGLLPFLKKIDDLSQWLPDPFDEDEAAAAHYHLFGFNVLPYEAVFRESPATGSATQLGGVISARVEQHYGEAGFVMGARDASADHIGHELAFLSYLSDAEADAWQNEAPKIARQMQQRQRIFLRDHLLPWLPALCQAISSQGEPFFTAVADLILALAQDHALSLSLLPPPQRENPQSRPRLDDENTGLRQIARYLATPSLSGFYLSQDAISAIARDLRLPRGFGPREMLLENLLQAAAQYDGLIALVESLDEALIRWDTAYRSAFVSELHSFVAPWQQRIAITRGLLGEMVSMARGSEG